MSLDEFDHKHILLDNNVLIELARNPKGFLTFREDLEKYKLTPLITQSVKFEFLRTSNSPASYENKLSYLDEYVTNPTNDDLLELSDNEEIFAHATDISMLYQSQLNYPLKPIDAIILGQLKKFGKQLLFATFDSQDFNTFILDRVAIYNIEIKLNSKPMSIYVFSQKKYDTAAEKFNKNRAEA